MNIMENEKKTYATGHWEKAKNQS